MRRTLFLTRLEDRLAPALRFAPTSLLDDPFSHFLLREDRVAVRFHERADAANLDGFRLVRWLDDATAVLEGDGVPANVAFALPVLLNERTKRDSVVIDEVIVSLRDPSMAESFFDDRFTGFRPLWGTTDQFVATLPVRGLGVVEAAALLAADPRVNWCEPNYYQDWQKFFNPNDIEYTSGNMWHHKNVGQNGGLPDADVDTDLAWGINPGGSANRLFSIVDDGIETTHPDLNPWVNPGEIPGDAIDNDGNGYVDDVHGWNFFANNNLTITSPADRHGTAVAGVAVARGNNGIGVVGPSYNARAMVSRIFEGTSATSNANIASAVLYAAGRNKAGTANFATVDVMNNSWGGGDASAAITSAFISATTLGRGGLGTVTLAASGNGYAGALIYPAQLAYTLPGLISVGGTNNKGTRSDFSNFGRGLDLVAPTSDLRSNYLGINTTDRVGAPGYNGTDYTGTGPGSFGGTSAATPLAAGIAGLVLSQAEDKGLSLTAPQVRNLMKNSTDLIGGAVYDPFTGLALEYGHGRINAFTAVDGVGKPELSVLSSAAEILSGDSSSLGTALVGGSTSRTFRVRNSGTSDLTLANLNVSSAKNAFSIDSGFAATTLKLGEATTFTVRFAPTSTGADSAVVSFTSNDANEATFSFTVTASASGSNISGRAFEDWSGDGTADAHDPGISRRTVFLDANANGKLDRVSFTSSPNQLIPDNNAVGIAVPLNVSGVAVPVRGLTVTVNLTHQYLGDVSLYLVSPAGTALQLAAANGADGTSFTNTVFDDEGTLSIDDGAAPFTGRFRLPFDPLSSFDGENANGTWTLFARDTSPFDIGTLQNWTLEFDAERAVNTDSQGQYAFGGLAPGSYTVRSNAPAGWTATGPVSHTVTIAGSADSFSRDFASAKNNRAYFRVRDDQNANGTFELSEPPVAGRILFHDANGNGLRDVATHAVFNKTANLAIPDFKLSGVSSSQTVSGLSGTLHDVNVTVTVPHAFVGDLRLNLISPAGTSVTLVNRRGGNGVNFTLATFDDSATIPAANLLFYQAPFAKTYIPESPLAALNGQTPNGVWQLQAIDNAPGNTGKIASWSLSLATSTTEPASTSSSFGNAFLDLPTGSSTVRLAPLAGWKFTSPADGKMMPNAAGAPIFETTFGVAEAVPPILQAAVVNGGGSQRSTVSSVRLDYSEAVTLNGPGLFSITGPDGSVPFTISHTGSQTTLDFAPLADGKYTLTLNAALITDIAQNALVPPGSFPFHRLLGDLNGDATVDAGDLALFGNAFGASQLDANYFAPADFTGEGTIDASDFALFGNRFGTTL